jgi:hypothetical protein
MAIKLNKLAAKPQLIKIVLDSDTIKAKYGDELEFYIYDRMQMAKFIELAQGLQENYVESIGKIESMILDENGKPVCTDGTVLPADVIGEAVTKLVEHMGK